MEFVTNEKLTIVGAAGMIGSNMAQTAIHFRYQRSPDRCQIYCKLGRCCPQSRHDS